MDLYRELEHTADIGLEIYGSTIDELFINGVRGLFHIISTSLEAAKKIKVFPKRQIPEVIELNASTQEDLLVQWLNEFVYNFFVKGVFPKTIKTILLTEKKIKAEVIFQKCGKTLKVSKEVKAATYHDLSIKKARNRYEARVIFDV